MARHHLAYRAVAARKCRQWREMAKIGASMAAVAKPRGNKVAIIKITKTSGRKHQTGNGVEEAKRKRN